MRQDWIRIVDRHRFEIARMSQIRKALNNAYGMPRFVRIGDETQPEFELWESNGERYRIVLKVLGQGVCEVQQIEFSDHHVLVRDEHTGEQRLPEVEAFREEYGFPEFPG